MLNMQNVPDWVPVYFKQQQDQFADELALKRDIAQMQANAQMYGSMMDAQSRAYVGDTAADAARYGADTTADSNAWQNASRERIADTEGQWKFKSTSEAARAALEKATLIQKMILAGKQSGARPFDLLQHLPEAARTQFWKSLVKNSKGDPVKAVEEYIRKANTYGGEYSNPVNPMSLMGMMGGE